MFRKIRNFITILFFLVLASGSYSQESLIDITILDLPLHKVVFKEFLGNQQILVEEAKTDHEGKVRIVLGEEMHPGIYRLEFDSNSGLDFIFSGEDVSIVIDKELSLSMLEVIKSEENRVFFEYLEMKGDYGKRIELLENMLMYYPSEDSFYFQMEEHYYELEARFRHFLDNLYAAQHRKFVSSIIQWDQLPDIDPSMIAPVRRNYLKAHYFDKVDLSDTLIVYTPLPTIKLIDYLTLYVNPGISMSRQEDDFIQGIDSLMSFFHDNKRLQEVMVNYMIDGFQHYGFERVLTYLVENYVLDQACVSDQEEEKLRTRIEGFKKMSVGKTAPDFVVPDTAGDLVSLSEVEQEYTLVIFWASWCPHCSSMMPELNKLYGRYKDKVEMIGISVDEDREEWLGAVNSLHLAFVNASELNGWDSPVIQDYFIYATPTFFLLDSNRKILAKPMNLSDLTGAIEEVTSH